MTPPIADQFKHYLAPEESLETVTTGSFSDGSWKSGSIGITDRRLLCASDDGRFVSVGFDAICTIRSRARETHTYRGNDYRLLIGSGSLLALLGFIGIVIFATNLFVLFLALLTVSGLVSAVYLSRTGEKVKWVLMARVTESFPYDVDGGDIRQRCESYVPDNIDERQLLLLGSGGLAVLGAIGLVLSNALVFLGVLALIGGITLVDYALRYEKEFDGFEIARRQETEMSINTDDSRTLYIRCNQSEEIVQELSRVVYTDDVKPTPIVSPRS